MVVRLLAKGFHRAEELFTTTHMTFDDGSLRDWAEMSDGELEHTLRNDLWLAYNSPNSHAGRIG
jgi:hypothetical protein